MFLSSVRCYLQVFLGLYRVNREISNKRCIRYLSVSSCSNAPEVAQAGGGGRGGGGGDADVSN